MQAEVDDGRPKKRRSLRGTQSFCAVACRFNQVRWRLLWPSTGPTSEEPGSHPREAVRFEMFTSRCGSIGFGSRITPDEPRLCYVSVTRITFRICLQPGYWPFTSSNPRGRVDITGDR